jgi:hypothetical protein
LGAQRPRRTFLHVMDGTVKNEKFKPELEKERGAMPSGPEQIGHHATFRLFIS